MTDVVRLHPPPTKCLDLAKKADLPEYIVIGIGSDGKPRQWTTAMDDVRKAFYMRWLAVEAEYETMQEIMGDD